MSSELEKNDAILNNFFDCVKNKDNGNITEAFIEVLKMPPCNRPEDQEYTPWKAYAIDERIYPTEDNIEFHRYISDFFDIAVKEHMSWRNRYGSNLEDMKRLRDVTSYPDYDGSCEIVSFLRNYRYLKDVMAKKGKEIFRPKVFDEYPFLEDYVKGIFRNDYDSVTQDAAQCKTIPELVKNKDAVNNYCNAGIFVYNATGYWHNIEKKYKEWGKQKWREIYTEAENETFKQGNIATLSDEEKKFILENTENKDRAIAVGKTVSNEVLDNWDIEKTLQAEILFAKTEKPEELSDADKEFILKWSESDKTLEAVAKVYDFKAQSSEKLKVLLRCVEHKEIRKDIAKEYIDSCKGDVAYSFPISRVFTKEEFEQAVEDYKITQYRRENEKLSAENTQLKEEHKNVEKAKTELADEQTKFQRYVNDKSAELKAKSEQLGFQKDIPVVCLGSQKEVDSFAPERKKELFAKMKEEMLKNPNLREGHLAAMCKIYASKTNTLEQKAEYFEGLHEVRKSGTTNAEKREMARTFGRVLERNPDLAKDEALKGLAKIDYSAVGYTPTQVGFLKNHIKDKTK